MPLALTPTPAPALSGLTATGALGGIKLLWNAPISTDLAFCEVWVSQTNDRTQATLAATIIGTSYFYQTATGNTRYFWVRSKNIYGRTDGAWEPALPTSGAVGKPTVITSADIDPNLITPNSVKFVEFNDNSFSSMNESDVNVFVPMTTQVYTFTGTGASTIFQFTAGQVGYWDGATNNPGTALAGGQSLHIDLEVVITNTTTGVQIYDQSVNDVTYYNCQVTGTTTVSHPNAAAFNFTFPPSTMVSGNNFRATVKWRKRGTPVGNCMCSQRYCKFDAR